jgi:hypothetical protein
MRKALVTAALLLGSTMLLSGCDQLSKAVGGKAEVKDTAYPEQVFWGDTHLHTANSPDAFGFGTRLLPEEALRFAKGEEVTSSNGIKAKLARPLDFLVITDHSEGLGSMMELYNAPRIAISDPQMLRWYDMMHEGREGALRATAEIIDAKAKGTLSAALTDPKQTEKLVRSTWEKNIDAVEDYNEPGKFTAFFGYEYTLMDGGRNLHRNVIFRDGPDQARQALPITSAGTAKPDELWDYMDAYEKQTGGKVLAIPHNSNMSNGWMFPLTEPQGGPMGAAYARRRAMREPVVEVTQIKGDSEAHPFMSPNDEFAGYGVTGWELGDLMMVEKATPEMQPGSYVRDALKRGLLIEQRTGANPYQFGVIGSTDSHTSLATPDEDNYYGKHSSVEPNPKRATEAQNLGSRQGRFGWHYLASGYAAVWATSNSRGAIFDAMMRREVYATTGTRMTVRVFGGWDFKADDLKGDWVKAGYTRGVPMGGQMKAGSGKPSFIISALKDPLGANLDRVQVIKGWVDKAGQAQEKVFNVAWSSPDKRKQAGGKLSAVGDTVDTAKATYTNTIGAPTLATVWSDPEFDPAQRAFYYLRVLEIPTPTWMAFDAVRFKLTLPPEIPLRHQERAYTSAIWYAPKG